MIEEADLLFLRFSGCGAVIWKAEALKNLPLSVKGFFKPKLTVFTLKLVFS